MSLIEFFSNHTYRMVFCGTSFVGLVAGCLGTFAYLRKQSLISDVISHSSLPGTLGAFLVMVVVIGGDGRNMVALIIGAVLTGTLSVVMANTIPRYSIVKIDAAMAAMLAFFFGAGMLIMRVITNGAFPGKGGIQDYLFGNASVITHADLRTIVVVGTLVLVLMVVFWHPYALRTFDPDACQALGFESRIIDALMFSTMSVATVIGIKSVGLVLMVAFIVTPPAAARQWTGRLSHMVALSGLIGALGSGLGAYASISLGKVPTGPLIVLMLFAIFVVSLVCAPRRSVAVRVWRRHQHIQALKAEAVKES